MNSNQNHPNHPQRSDSDLFDHEDMAVQDFDQEASPKPQHQNKEQIHHHQGKVIAHENTMDKNNSSSPRQMDNYQPESQSPIPNLRSDSQFNVDSQFQTPMYQNQTGPTLSTEGGISPFPKKSATQKKGLRTQQSLNFIQRNKTVKTRDQLFQEFSEKKKERISTVQLNKSHSSLMFPLDRQRSTSRHSSHSRQQDWHKITLNNDLISKEKTSYQGTKNYSKDFVVKHMEVSYQDLLKKGIPSNNRGGTFSRNRREKWYHMTNSSSITRLNSYQSLDLPEKGEVREFPTTKGNQQLKRAMNQSQVFERTNNYLKDEAMPEGFNQHQPRNKPVHNMNNTQVQSMRLKNISSKVF